MPLVIGLPRELMSTAVPHEWSEMTDRLPRTKRMLPPPTVRSNRSPSSDSAMSRRSASASWTKMLVPWKTKGRTCW